MAFTSAVFMRMPLGFYFEEKFSVMSDVESLYHEAIVVRTRATAVHGAGRLTGNTGNSPAVDCRFGGWSDDSGLDTSKLT